MKKNYLSTLFFFAAALLLTHPAPAQDGNAAANSQPGQSDSVMPASAVGAEEHAYRDLYSDTWVGTDALGRTMPGYDEVGPVKTDHRRVVGMFYITWHQDDKAKLKAPYTADVTKILSANPHARLDAKDSLWAYDSYHWGEPEAGYFLSRDKYVIRRDMSMLSDAGVDVLIMDVTNAVSYWDEWDTIFGVMEEMKSQGNKVPKICFWAFNGPVITVVQGLYDRIYKAGRYKDLWYYWDGKPLFSTMACQISTPTARGSRTRIPTTKAPR